MRSWRWMLFAGLVLLALVAGWRLVGMVRSDAALDAGRAEQALRWRPDNPEALLREAVRLRGAGDLAGADAAAKRLLSASPADGRGYRVLAQVAAERGDQARAERLFTIAAVRAPRDLEARAWLVQQALTRGDAQVALEHIDQVLRHSPGSGARLFPLLGTLSATPEFGDALSARLAAQPPWRGPFLGALQANRAKDPDAIDRVLSGLEQRGGLGDGEFDAWIESLMQQGRWGEAFARWASRRIERGQPVSPLFNGDFGLPPTGVGFDWRLRKAPGVLTAFERSDQGQVLRMQFLGRRVAGGALVEHAMLLPPGTYQLKWRERTDAVRAGAGLAWQLACAGSPAVVAQADPTDGTRPWRERVLVFTVPSDGCEGQWLRFGSVGSLGSGQILAGEARFAQFTLVANRGKE